MIADDQDRPMTPVSPVERVNRLLGRLYRMRRQIAAYDELHTAEIERLTRRRSEAIGPVERRCVWLERVVEQFAVRWYEEFGDASHRIPNGDITSKPVLDTIIKDDDTIAEWADGVAGGGLVAWKPTVGMKDLRVWLAARVAAGHLQRMVYRRGEQAGEDEFALVDEEGGWHREFDKGFEGVWFWTGSGAKWAAINGIDAHEGQIVEGVTWCPNGTMGSGRNFRIKL